MRILVIKPGCRPEIWEISGTLKSMQKIVGGLIQVLYPFDESMAAALVCNDEGKLLGLPLNRGLRDEDGEVYDIIGGTFFICGTSEGNFATLTEDQIQHFQQLFAVPEVFLKFDKQLVILAEDHTAPSSTGGDYSPSCPWDAPGMGPSDFI